jgi:hypothetical protein
MGEVTLQRLRGLIFQLSAHGAQRPMAWRSRQWLAALRQNAESSLYLEELLAAIVLRRGLFLRLADVPLWFQGLALISSIRQAQKTCLTAL